MNAPLKHEKRGHRGPSAQDRFLADLLLRGILEEGHLADWEPGDRNRIVNILCSSASHEMRVAAGRAA